MKQQNSCPTSVKASSTSASMSSPFTPEPKENWTLISQGAEARVWKLEATGVEGRDRCEKHTIVCKERFSKAYRHPDLDERLTKSRCRGEARSLEKCTKKTGIRVPGVIRVDPPLLFTEFIEGPNLKAYLLDKERGSKIDYTVMAQKIGEIVGKLHNLGVIHGDLTTSNILVDEEGGSFDLVFIDFGLAKSTTSAEEQAVDLYVLERALQSTHPELPDNFLDMILEAYDATTDEDCDTANKKSTKPNQQSTLKRLEQVRLRGRKRECFG